MRELVEAIRARGVGVGTDIVKVDMFLNHRLDTDLFVRWDRRLRRPSRREKPDLVLDRRGQRHCGGADDRHGLRQHPGGLCQEKPYPQRNRRRIRKPGVQLHSWGGKPHPRGQGLPAPKARAFLIVDDFLANGEGRRGPVRLGQAGRGDRGGHWHLCGKELPAGPPEAGGGRLPRGFTGQGDGHPRRKADRGGLKKSAQALCLHASACRKSSPAAIFSDRFAPSRLLRLRLRRAAGTA